MGRPGFIYVIQSGDTNCYKIGQTTSQPMARLRGLQTGSPVELRMHEVYWSPDIDRDERRAHRLVWRHRVRGEWFTLTERRLLAIRQLFMKDEIHTFYDAKDLRHAMVEGLRDCHSMIGDYGYGDVIPLPEEVRN